MKLLKVITLFLMLGCFAITAESHPASYPTPSPSPSPSVAPSSNTQRSEGFFGWFFRVTGISATPRNERDDHKPNPGRIWIANLQGNTSRMPVQTDDSGYISPVFFNDGQNILAVQGTNVVSVSIDSGQKQVLHEVKGVLKLIGFSADDPDKVLLLRDEDQDSCPGVAVLSLSARTVTPLPYKKESDDQSLLTHLVAWTRTYDDGEFELQTKKIGRNTWFDVLLKRKNKDGVNISMCEAVNCTQPSLSKDRLRVVFIKEG